MLYITSTVSENFTVLCVDANAAVHENVVRDYCAQNEIPSDEVHEFVFTVSASEAEKEVLGESMLCVLSEIASAADRPSIFTNKSSIAKVIELAKTLEQLSEYHANA